MRSVQQLLIIDVHRRRKLHCYKLMPTGIFYSCLTALQTTFEEIVLRCIIKLLFFYMNLCSLNDISFLL